MKQFTLLICSWILALGLTGCGGGGGGDDSSNSSSPASSSENSTSEDDTVTMASIKVAPDYDFTTSQQLEVNIDLRSLTDQRVYVGFYQQWSGDDNSPVPNPDSQLLLQVIDDGLLNQTLTIGKQQQSLLMVVMFADTGISPVTDVFAVDGGEYAYP
ncbi:hypothetical protein ACQKPX_08350 [Photobacterium sp. DNB23_23_1]|uniref:Uncharacterized protein n=2 Tax=Photobacterium pectinilyticum TaxID=2906793 RepID=A0ABT1MXJ1_9GAMM|nr:hypothetical protein [Photobacterium sp. ZSDE20]MDD1821346.1 hypothetical protein [Photobacterium sp. ZSDE20]